MVAPQNRYRLHKLQQFVKKRQLLKIKLIEQSLRTWNNLEPERAEAFRDEMAARQEEGQLGADQAPAAGKPQKYALQLVLHAALAL